MKETPMTLTPQAARCMMEAAAVAAASLFAVAAAQAQTEPDGKWHGAISLGGAFATGNTDTLSVTLAADATKVRPIDRVSLSGLVNYGKSTINGVDTTTADQAWIRGRYDYNLTEVVFVFGGAGPDPQGGWYEIALRPERRRGLQADPQPNHFFRCLCRGGLLRRRVHRRQFGQRRPTGAR
ncbi:MAG: DUF481 domain-containing protein [Ideonella sp.]|nr:DUF481 domain-containing protein [Ideonella sp.]